MSDYQLHLISFDVCPYVERSRITLEEKGVDYDITFIDLSDKPDWFLEMSPRGKVPVLEIDGEPIFESAVINEALEELYPSPRMLPEDPIERARARAWIAYNDDVLMPATATLWFSDSDDEINQARETLLEAFERVERALGARDGEFFLGDTFSLVDSTYAPVFNRWPIAEAYGHDDLLDEFDRLESYARRLEQHPSSVAGRDPELIDKMLDDS
jgi:glutathione S-transferase